MLHKLLVKIPQTLLLNVIKVFKKSNYDIVFGRMKARSIIFFKFGMQYSIAVGLWTCRRLAYV